MRLDKVIHNVIPDPKESYTWEAEKDIGIMQLSLIAKPGLFGDGDHVRLTGTLYQGFNPHHHTRVLMSVDQVEVLAKGSGVAKPAQAVLHDGVLE